MSHIIAQYLNFTLFVYSLVIIFVTLYSQVFSDFVLYLLTCLPIYLGPIAFFMSLLPFFFFLVFLGPYLQHMEVPRPGVELELQMSAYTTATATQDLSCICKTGSLAHWARPGIEPASSWILVGFVSAAPQWELPLLPFKFNFLLPEEYPFIVVLSEMISKMQI